MLVDEVIITVKGGNGGNGAATFKRNAQTAKGGPDGGNGGNGGDLYFEGVNDITALSIFSYTKSVSAEDGVSGGKQNLYGRNGKDITVKVPIGTEITDLNTNQVIEILNINQKLLIAKGGKGGRGNNEFKSATNQTPKYRELGEKGVEKKLRMILKLVADIGLIGLPNAGKSSLLEVLTNAHPKIGNYPFTTLEPNLGVIKGLIISDIPGLIEGASLGKGLGDKFLRHVEKTRILIHCLDSMSIDLKKDYQTIRRELEVYNPTLLNKKELLLLTKSDLVDEKTLKKNMNIAEKLNSELLSVSIYDDINLDKLRAKILKFSKK
jgi:GTP-binding protein